jgi:hypothetical protein
MYDNNNNINIPGALKMNDDINFLNDEPDLADMPSLNQMSPFIAETAIKLCVNGCRCNHIL